jgi:transposase
MLTSAEVRGKWVLSVEDWAEIRRLHRAERMPVKVIARVLGCSRNTVRNALAAEGPPVYRRHSTGSVVDAVEPRIRELLQACPTMPATVIAERIEWRYSIRTLSGRVAELRPIYVPPDPASRTTYLAGEIAQCDFWFPPIRLPVGFGQTRTAAQLPVLTMITGYARWASGLLVPTRRAEDLYAGWWRLIEQLGAVPRVLVWDGEAAVGRWRSRQSELTSACQGFRGVLGVKVLICKPADPEAKGGVERLHDYLERSFLPGRRSARLLISTPSFRRGCSWRIAAANGPWGVPRRTASSQIRRRCCHCRRCRQPLDGSTHYGCRGTTMCAWTATTTRCTPARWAAESWSVLTWTASGCGVTATWSPITSGSGRDTKPCPIPPT